MPEVPPAVWPATTLEDLDALRADATAGRRPDLLDPRAVAGACLTERLAGPGRDLPADVGLAVGPFEPGAPGEGPVGYDAAGSAGTVALRRLGGDGGVWYVTGSSAARLAVRHVGYDGTDLDGEVVAGAGGTLEVTVRPVDGSDPVSTEVHEVEAGQPLPLAQRFAGKPGLLVALELAAADGTVVLAEVRVDAPLPAGPTASAGNGP